MEPMLAALRAAAEPTRLRLIALCANGELTVTELTQILGQSQPRVSRHLKLLCDGGVLERFREGAWVFYRLAARGEGAALAAYLCARLDPSDPDFAADALRLQQARAARTEKAAAYFSENAADWDRVRRLHVDDAEVERAVLALFDGREIVDLLDLGVGAGGMLRLLGPRCRHGLGLDMSREMLAAARANLDQAGLAHCSVRQADLHHPPTTPGAFDAVTMHQVLHYLDDPAAAVAAAARMLRPGGRLVLVDFAPHDREDLRERHAHRRLGFPPEEPQAWLARAGLVPLAPLVLPGGPLTVVVWAADRPDGAVAAADASARSVPLSPLVSSSVVEPQ